MLSPKAEPGFPTEAYLPALLETMQQIDLIHRLVDKYSDHLTLATKSNGIQAIFRGGKIAVMIGVEGLHQIANSPAVLRLYHRLGVRYVTLTHNSNNLYADSAVCFHPRCPANTSQSNCLPDCPGLSRWAVHGR